MSATDSLHYQLCVEGAKWLRRKKYDYDKCKQRDCRKPEFCRVCKQYQYIAVELNTYGGEQTDVWAWGTSGTAVIEVKTSHADFVNDAKKPCRQESYRDLWCGIIRWYLCPENVIKPDELPPYWGLLYWDGKRIKHVAAPTPDPNHNYCGDMFIIHSLLRRENFPQKIFNYRGTNTTIKPQHRGK